MWLWRSRVGGSCWLSWLCNLTFIGRFCLMGRLSDLSSVLNLWQKCPKPLIERSLRALVLFGFVWKGICTWVWGKVVFSIYNPWRVEYKSNLSGMVGWRLQMFSFLGIQEVFSNLCPASPANPAAAHRDCRTQHALSEIPSHLCRLCLRVDDEGDLKVPCRILGEVLSTLTVLWPPSFQVHHTTCSTCLLFKHLEN